MANILIIEPDIILAQNYRSVLEADGHAVRWQSDGQTAVHAMDDEVPDVILLELQMPVHNGLEFLYEVRSYPEWSSIPVIVVSMVPRNDFDGSGEQLKRLRVSDYLYKPSAKLRHISEAVSRTLDAVNA